MNAALLREQALEAVRAASDYAPSNGQRYDLAEAEMLGRLCANAYRACQAAGVTIAKVRAELWRQEREARAAALWAIQAEVDEVEPADGELPR